MPMSSRPWRCLRRGIGTTRRRSGAAPARAACATPSSNSRLTPARSAIARRMTSPAGDIDTCTDVMQSDFTGGENIDQEKLSGGYGDGEINLASTEGIDQRWAASGSRTDREVDDFAYDEPKHRCIEESPSAAAAKVSAEFKRRKPTAAQPKGANAFSSGHPAMSGGRFHSRGGADKLPEFPMGTPPH
jgi:hypothetical protein